MRSPEFGSINGRVMLGMAAVITVAATAWGCGQGKDVQAVTPKDNSKLTPIGTELSTPIAENTPQIIPRTPEAGVGGGVPPAQATEIAKTEVAQSPTAAATATQQPTEAATATGTATRGPEPAATPKELQNPLPEYVVWTGTVTKVGDPNTTGSLIISHIPSYDNHVYVGGVAQRRVIIGAQLSLTAADKKNFTGGSKTSGPKIEVTIRDSGELSVALVDAWGTSWTTPEDMRNVGSGGKVLTDSARKAWATGMNNDPSTWTKVPEETVIGTLIKFKLP